MKRFFRFMASLMITVIIATTTAAAYVQPVEAATSSIWKKAGTKFVEAIAGVFGTVLGEGAVEVIGINEMMQAYIDSIYGTDDLIENEDGTFTFSEESITQLKTLLDEYFAQEENIPDVVWMPVIRANEFPASSCYTTTLYYQIMSYMDTHDLAIFNYVGSSKATYVSDMSDRVFVFRSGYNSDGYLKNQNNYFDFWVSSWGAELPDPNNNGPVTYPLTYLTLDGVGTYAFQDGQFTSDGWTDLDGTLSMHNYGNILYPWYKTSAALPEYVYIIASSDFESRYIPIYRNASAYKDYITGNADYYQLTPTYQGGALTVDPNIDYGQLYDAVSAAMSNSAANGENITQQLSAMQSAYEKTMQEISGTLGDIEDNTEQSNSWLEKIYNNTASIASILIEQFDSMTETITDGFAGVINGLTDLTFGLGEIGSSGGDSDSDNGGSKLSFWDKLGNFFGSALGGIFGLIELIVMKALDGVAWLANKLVDNLGKALDGVTAVMDRYTQKLTESNTLSKLGEALPDEIKYLLTFSLFGVICAGIICTAKK